MRAQLDHSPSTQLISVGPRGSKPNVSRWLREWAKYNQSHQPTNQPSSPISSLSFFFLPSWLASCPGKERGVKTEQWKLSLGYIGAKRTQDEECAALAQERILHRKSNSKRKGSWLTRLYVRQSKKRKAHAQTYKIFILRTSPSREKERMFSLSWATASAAAESTPPLNTLLTFIAHLTERDAASENPISLVRHYKALSYVRCWMEERIWRRRRRRQWSE